LGPGLVKEGILKVMGLPVEGEPGGTGRTVVGKGKKKKWVKGEKIGSLNVREDRRPSRTRV